MAFKMTGKSPMAKALVGKQHKLPEELKAKIEASPIKHMGHGKGLGMKHHGGGDGSVSGEEGSRERRLKTTRAKLVKKQHVKKKGTIGNAIRKTRVKGINRKLKADGNFYSNKGSKTKTIESGGKIEF